MNNAAKPSSYIQRTIVKHHGYTIGDVVNSTHMRLQFYSNNNNSAVDDTWVVANFPR